MNRILLLALSVVFCIGCKFDAKDEAAAPPKIPMDVIATVVLKDGESTKVFSNKLLAITKDESILLFSPSEEVYPSTNGVDEPFVSLVQRLNLDAAKALHGTIFVDEQPQMPYTSKTGWKLRFGEPAPGSNGPDYAVLHIDTVNPDAKQSATPVQTTAPPTNPYIGLEETRLPGPKP